MVAYYTSPGLLLLFYIKIETLPGVFMGVDKRTHRDELAAATAEQQQAITILIFIIFS
jgi:hypothetical protein